MLTTVYDLHTTEDLVEIVYAYRIHKSIAFLKNYLSLDNDYQEMHGSMIRFVLLGKHLEKNCRTIDHVPPLHEIDWNQVRDLIYRQAHETMVEMNKQYALTLHR